VVADFEILFALRLEPLALVFEAFIGFPLAAATPMLPLT
jgi:hypothetical protein